MKRAYLILIDFVLPLPMTAVMYWLWYRRTGDGLFSLYVLALGVLFGYIFPGIGTNILHLWKFNGPFRIKNYFLHHGFLYAPYMALVFYLVFATDMPLTAENMVRVVLCAGFVQCVLSCHHDTWGVATGMIEIATVPGAVKRSPVEVVTSFGVIGFWLVGATYSASCLMAYRAIVLGARSDWATFALLLAGGLTLMGLAALQHLFAQRALVFGPGRARKG
ncbi:hypothetical protein [uncultured Paludibaculum sp.]|uniref:hypothetical protein n=1 Tax=uncultured Paludibaculum sp. TaxID=1765020 RepID=UPI002AAB29B4|nr:hypothetical protein [uncultured Paludibaculum sp.]